MLPLLMQKVGLKCSPLLLGIGLLDKGLLGRMTHLGQGKVIKHQLRPQIPLALVLISQAQLPNCQQ